MASVITAGGSHKDSSNSGPGVVSSGSSSSISSAAKAISQLVSSSGSQFANNIREVQQNALSNSALSQSYAAEQMDFQRESQQTAMAFNAEEAQKNRDWQTKMSNTAHQREVADLVKAGLNPVLSANGGAYTGSGASASVGSSNGAMGSVDNSTSALSALFGNIINAASNENIAKMTQDNNRQIAEFNGMIDKYVSDNSLAGSRALAGASMYSADQNRIASAYAADQANFRQSASDQAAAQRLVYGQTEENKRNEANVNAKINSSPISWATNFTDSTIKGYAKWLAGLLN